jgi:uncharacterized membrane protein
MPTGLGAEIFVGGHAWLTQFVILLLVIGIPALVVWGAVSLWRDSATRRTSPPDPELILKLRLARGEISVEEYERLRGLIRYSR